MCGRRVGRSLVAGRAFLAIAAAFPLFLVLAVFLGRQQLTSVLMWSHTTPKDAYSAAVTYLEKTPEFRGVSDFSREKDSVIERWGPARYRIAGFADLDRQAGSRIRDYYSCVLHYTGQNGWEVEDLHFERVE